MTDVGVSGSGHISARVVRSDGSIKAEHDFCNDVLVSGLERIIDLAIGDGHSNGAGFAGVRYLHLGTGTTEPTPYDAGLESRSGTLGGKVNTENFLGTDSSWINNHQNNLNIFRITLEFSYGEGQAEGVWTELGLADQYYNNPITRALFRDSNGDPISLTILSDEFLRVTYTLDVAFSFPETTFTLDGTTYTANFSARAQDGMDFFYGGNNTFQPADVTYTTFGFREAADGGYSGPYTITASYNPATQELPIEMVLDPSSSDLNMGGLTIGKPVFSVAFDPLLVKKKDYKVTLDLSLTFNTTVEPVSGLDATADSSSIIFTWDAYPDATQYNLILRKSGVEVATQTITAPTTTATFSGLDASSAYQLDIQAETTQRPSTSAIKSASTTA